MNEILKNSFIVTAPVRIPKGLEKLRPILYQTKAIIAGGYARYCCSALVKPYPYSDLDIFAAPYQVDRIRTFFLREGCMLERTSPYFVGQFSTHWSDSLYGLPTIQLIQDDRTPAQILSDFDMTVCAASIRPVCNHWVAYNHTNFDIHEKNKLIVRLNENSPHWEYRKTKYLGKGYRIPTDSELEKLQAF